MKGSPSGRIRIQRRSASPLEGRHSPASSRRAMNLSINSGWRQLEHTSMPILGSTPASPRSILTATFFVSFQGSSASLRASVLPCQPIAFSPSKTDSHTEKIITRRMISSSPRLDMVPICLIEAPFGRAAVTRSREARNRRALRSPINGGSILSHSSE